MINKIEKTTDYRKEFSDALKACLAESGIVTAANLHKEMDARGYPVNDSTVRRYVSGNVLPPETAFGMIQTILEPNITKESMDRLERTYLAAADERGYAVEKIKMQKTNRMRDWKIRGARLRRLTRVTTNRGSTGRHYMRNWSGSREPCLGIGKGHRCSQNRNISITCRQKPCTGNGRHWITYRTSRMRMPGTSLLSCRRISIL